eukprot:jgi/Psemu1/304745/fgenesh1_kg.168_\
MTGKHLYCVEKRSHRLVALLQIVREDDTHSGTLVEEEMHLHATIPKRNNAIRTSKPDDGETTNRNDLMILKMIQKIRRA